MFTADPTQPQRPIPALTPHNEFFWTSGRDGVLRVQRSVTCGALIHPPQPVCPHCRSTDIEIVEVSGRATVVGCTVNYQPWHPAIAPPYSVAMVALEEDDRVRLTTNIVGCDPESVTIGMKVQARFEEHGDVFLPLFTPTGDAEPGTVPHDDPSWRTVRPMASKEKFEDRVAITGLGMSPPARRSMRNPLAMTVEACLAAIADAGLTPEDIDGLSTYPSGGPMGGFAEGGVTALEFALRLRPTWHSGGMETPGQAGSIVNAMLAVAAGLCRHVLCFRTIWESSHAELARRGRLQEGGGGKVQGEMGYRMPFGAMSAANWIGMNASLYMHRFGATRETLGWIAVNARRNAALNPHAIYTDPMSIDDYLSARMITTPFGLYDCDVPCDGAVAVVVSAKDVAKDLARTPILVEAVGTQITEPVSWDQGTLEHEPQVLGPARHLWTRTDLRHGDVDLALLYDGFTFNCLSWIEALGFCGWGEAKDFLDGGTRIARDGELPLNPHGGQLSAGRLHGYGFVHEAITQLRGDAGERQIPDARVAVMSSGGGTPGSAFLLRRG